MKKRKDKKNYDYISVSAALRARETRMLDDDRIAQAIAAQTKEDAAKVIAECGMPDMSDLSSSEIDAALSDWRRRTFDELEQNGACAPIVDLFRLKYDYHNVKVLVKAMAENTDGGPMLSACGRVAPDALTDAFNRGARGGLPKDLAAAMSGSVGIMGRTKNPQLSDIYTDGCWFKEYLRMAEELGCPAVTDYARLQIDATNLKTAVRMLRLGRTWEHLEPALIPGGTKDPAYFASLSPSGDELPELFVGTVLAESAALGKECVSGGALTEFEKSVDDALARALESVDLVAFGPEVVFNHLCAVENSVSAARMILAGKLFGIAPEDLRERMRRSYV